MRKMLPFALVGFVVGLILTISTPTVAASGMQTQSQEVQIATRASPTLASFTTSASLNLINASGFRVVVCSRDPAGGMAAVGSLKAWVLDHRLSRPTRNKQLDLDMTTQEATTSGACILFPDQTVGVPIDQVIYAASGLKLEDGGTLLVQTDGGLDAGAFEIDYRAWSVTR